jgi:glycerol-3-phosphate acyltransferase PlsY
MLSKILKHVCVVLCVFGHVYLIFFAFDGQYNIL